MDKELFAEYENPDYPVTVNFIEIKKEDGAKGEWVVRPGDIEFIIVNNGELKISCSDKVHKVGVGQGVWLINGCRHKITSSQKEDTAFYSLVFNPEFAIGKLENNSLSDKYYEPLQKRFKNTCDVLDEANLRDETAIDRINSIIVANTIKKQGYEIHTKGHLCILWALMLDYIYVKESQYNGKNLPSQDELRVQSAINYMQESYADPITLEDIANRIHVSRNECCRCFKRVMMVSPIDFLIRLRVFEAAKLLYKDPMSVDTISELGFSVGFNNISYFNRMFKRYLNCTPREFSKMLKTDSELARKYYDNLQESVTGI